MAVLGLIIMCLSVSVHAHGRLTRPQPRAPLWAESSMTGFTSATSVHRENQPVYTLTGPMTHDGHPYTTSSYRCHDFASAAPATTITAGGTLDLEWTFAAAHPGDCALYISYDSDVAAPTTWIKLLNLPGCVDQATFPTFGGVAPPSNNAWSFTLPTWLATCTHCVLRWEWYSVQQVSNIEFYVACVDVAVTGTSETTATMLSKVSPTVQITGTDNMPAAASGYRLAYNGQFGEQYVAGPAIASYSSGGGGGGASPAATPSRPPTPSVQPSPTSAPASSPLPASPPATDDSFTTSTVQSSQARRAEFIAALTTLQSVQVGGAAVQARAVHSSGGAAGGVVSEGQGYGLLIGGATLAAMTPAVGDVFWDTAVQETYETYLGWRRMFEQSKALSSCQSPMYCGEGCPAAGSSTDPDCFPCFPHWKFDDSLGANVPGSTGPATDGDEDAVIGMILLVLATAPVKATYPWWDSVALITYQSCKQFYHSNTIAGIGANSQYRLPRLGACWGGFDCNNPSYHAPGAMRAMRDFMSAYDSVVGTTADDTPPQTEGDTYLPLWNTAVLSSYKMLSDNQCSSNGLTTNWFVPGSPIGAGLGDTSCSGSGTPAAEFGSEASRGVWRVTMDWLWYGKESTANGGPDLAAFGPQEYLDRVGAQLARRHNPAAACPGCWQTSLVASFDPGCPVTAVHADWSSNAFMFAPVFSSLVANITSLSTGNQQTLIDAAGSKLVSQSITDYYSGSWVAIATLTLNGDLKKAGALISAASPPTAQPTTSPTASPPPAASAQPQPGSGTFVRHGYLENWVAMDTASLADLTAVFYGFLTLDPTPSAASPRQVQWNGAAIYESMTGADVMEVMNGNPNHAWHKQSIDRITTYCAANGKKFIWAIGGWSDLTLTISDAQIPSLVDKIANLLSVAGDGVDLDFEHLSSHTDAVLQQQRLVVGKLIVALKAKFVSTPGLENMWIVYTPRYNAFFQGGSHGSNQFATDGEGLDVFNHITANSPHGIGAVDYVNLMMYDIDARSAFTGATQPYFVQSHYDTVVQATAAVVGLDKTVIGFEPRRPQAYTGVWAGMNLDKQTIQHLVGIGAGGAMWWAMNDAQMSDGKTCGENSVEQAAYATAAAANMSRPSPSNSPSPLPLPGTSPAPSPGGSPGSVPSPSSSAPRTESQNDRVDSSDESSNTSLMMGVGIGVGFAGCVAVAAAVMWVYRRNSARSTLNV